MAVRETFTGRVLGFDEENGVEIRYREFSCSSTDTKPTIGVGDGSFLMESNTGVVFTFNEDAGDWTELFPLKAT